MGITILLKQNQITMEPSCRRQENKEWTQLKYLDQGYRIALMLAAHVPHVDWSWLATYVQPLKRLKHVPWLTSACVTTNPILFLSIPHTMSRVPSNAKYSEDFVFVFVLLFLFLHIINDNHSLLVLRVLLKYHA